MSLALVLACSVLIGATPAPQAGAAAPRLKVGVVVSAQTQAWVDRHNRGYDTLRRQQKVLSYLQGTGRYDVVQFSDADLASRARLDSVDVVVLTYNFAMDSTPAKTLQAWVKDGGGLVSMLASPRVAPEKDVSAAEAWSEHWVHILNSQTFEWGPLSEVYQLFFINDPGAPHYKIVQQPGTAHPIISGAQQLLSDRGQAGPWAWSGYSKWLDRDFSGAQGGGVEIARLLRNNGNAVPFLSFYSYELTKASNNPAIGIHAGYPGMGKPGTYPAAVASKYEKGRGVDFTFCPADFLTGYNDTLAFYPDSWAWGKRNTAGQGNAAGALIESSIDWAGTSDGTVGRILRGGRTWASLNVYRDGIYVSQYVGNVGNVSTTGNLFLRVYDPAGRLVKSWTHPAYVGVDPGSVYRYSNSYRARLASGTYRVEVEYAYSYPTWTNRWKEVAYVRAGQGTGIGTVVTGNTVPRIAGLAAGPSPFSPDADGFSDWTYATMDLLDPAFVDVKVYDSRWNLVAAPVVNQVWAAGKQSGRWNGKRSSGSWLPPGKYYYSVQARNAKGRNSLTTPVYLTYNQPVATPSLPATDLSVTSRTVGPWVSSASSDGTTTFNFTTNQEVYVTIRVLNYAREVAKVVTNHKVGPGPVAIDFDGHDDNGVDLPKGNYDYYLQTSTGGGAPRTALYLGTVNIRQ
jgi:flagellar hook assembly protein FlgD